MTEHHRWTAILWTMAVMGVAALFYVLTSEADAHEAPSGINYPAICCSNRDCKAAPAGSVRETSDGYVIVSTGEVVPYSDRRVKDALDTDMHLCQQAGNFDTGRVLCLFPPLMGF